MIQRGSLTAAHSQRGMGGGCTPSLPDMIELRGGLLRWKLHSSMRSVKLERSPTVTVRFASAKGTAQGCLCPASAGIMRAARRSTRQRFYSDLVCACARVCLVCVCEGGCARVYACLCACACVRVCKHVCARVLWVHCIEGSIPSIVLSSK
jgi:hypothetical protein